MTKLDRWDPLLTSFRAHHGRKLTNGLHLLVTPLGLWGALSLAALVQPWLPLMLSVGYLLTLVTRVPLGVWVSTVTGLAGLVFLTWWAHLGVITALACLALAGLAHELLHVLAGERARPGVAASWRDHLEGLYFLPSLVLASTWEVSASPLWWVVAQDRVVHVRLDDARSLKDLSTLARWVERREGTVARWRAGELPDAEQAAIRRLASAPELIGGIRGLYGRSFRVEEVAELDEIALSSPEQPQPDDDLYYASHVDGPFSFWPFCSVFRCLITVTPNEHVRTHFPMVDPGYEDGGRTYVLDRGEVVAYDLHRELNLTSADEGDFSGPPRAVLQVHYATYPQVLAPMGRALSAATIATHRAAQAAATGAASSTWGQWLWRAWVAGSTGVIPVVERWVGASNLAYVALLAVVSAALGSWLPLIIGGSFVHYLCYIGTYQQGRRVSFNTWVRDAVFFKVVSYVVLVVLYLQHLDRVAAWGVVLLVVGHVISAVATKVLGFERTYFGVELGLAEPRRVTDFPYGVVPHPMITGSVIGLLGIHQVTGFAVPWLVPVHIAFYALHLAQEISGTHRRFAGVEA